MKILKSKNSRFIFIIGIVVTFIIFHFTNVVDRGGVKFVELFQDFERNFLLLPLYVGIIFGIPLVLSILLPSIYRWIKSGE